MRPVAPMLESERCSHPKASLSAEGRLNLYEIILDRMAPPVDYVLGRGRWAPDTAGPPEQSWHAHHPDSVYLATFYRGGGLGLMALGTVMFIGLVPCWREARAGRPVWLILAGFGMMTNFLICYTTTFEMFPLRLRATAMKWCNIISRAITITAPLAAELPDPRPIQLVIGFIIISFGFAFFLDNPRKF